MKIIRCYYTIEEEAGETDKLDTRFDGKFFSKEDVEEYEQVRRLMDEYNAGIELSADTVAKIEACKTIEESVMLTPKRVASLATTLRHLFNDFPNPTEVHVVLDCGLSVGIRLDDKLLYIYEIKGIVK